MTMKSKTLIALIGLLLTSCNMDWCDEKTAQHKYGDWKDTGYKDPYKDDQQQEHTCTVCGFKELRRIHP